MGKVKKYYFERETTDIIKGLLLISMFILHFFCFPDWYIKGIEYPDLLWMEKFQGHFQICIAGFTFLTGYLYYSTTSRCFKYILKKWKDILIPYWFVLGVFFLIAWMSKSFFGNIQTLLLEILTLNHTLIFFGWYVSYYLIMIFTMWFVVKFIKNDCIKWIVSLVGSYLVYLFCMKFIQIDFITDIMEKFSVYFPIAVTGYLCSKREFFEKLDKLLVRENVIYAIVLIVIVFMEPSWLYEIKINNILFEITRKCIRITSIPFFLYGVIVLIRKVRCALCRDIIERIGENSMLMWFVHSIFFNCSKTIFQPILYLPRIPFFVLIWGLVLCLGISIVINLALKNIRCLINRV